MVNLPGRPALTGTEQSTTAASSSSDTRRRRPFRGQKSSSILEIFLRTGRRRELSFPHHFFAISMCFSCVFFFSKGASAQSTPRDKPHRSHRGAVCPHTARCNPRQLKIAEPRAGEEGGGGGGGVQRLTCCLKPPQRPEQTCHLADLQHQ